MPSSLEHHEGAPTQVILPLEELLTPFEEMVELVKWQEEERDAQRSIHHPLGSIELPGTPPEAISPASKIASPGSQRDSAWVPGAQQETKDFFVSPAGEAAARIEGLREKAMLDTSNYAVRLELARAYHIAGQLDKALEEYQVLATSSSPLLGEAVQDIEDMVSQGIGGRFARELLAQAYTSSKRTEDALAVYRELYADLTRKSID